MTSAAGQASRSGEVMSGRDQLLKMPFQAGASHIAGKYGFTQNNFLLEGANQMQALGSDCIFVYLKPGFRELYPDKSSGLWPQNEPANLTQLAQTPPYKTLFSMPFRTFVITAYSFANGDNVTQFTTNPQAASSEEREFYDLTRYLYATYSGSGKTFILKHWEGDYIGLQGFDVTQNISPAMIQAMNVWLSARQRGVARARADLGEPLSVGVFHAVEVSRVLDYSRQGLTRVINAVVPVVKPDMVTYSSYDSSLLGSDPVSASTSLLEALDVIARLAPDPLNIGNRRILISEFGLFENERASETVWRAQTILQTAAGAGLLGAFAWQVYDNECKDSAGNYFPIDSSLGSAVRPAASNCRGLWLIKPDGSRSSLVSVLSQYWGK
jgi:hypothetical protein